MNSPTVMAPSFCLAPTAVDSRVRRFQALALSLSALLALLAASTAGAAGILQIKNGYFWDPLQQNYFIPRGFGYQTFNPPVGADQSLEQLAYDFTEFKKLYANSSRVEMVWNQVETAHGVFDWSKVDFMVEKADELGMRLFVLIGYQYAPGWFPGSWTATNDVGGGSVVVNYEHPNARQAYSNYVYQVTLRYKDRAAIGAWILGNEYAYFDLWNTNRSFLGYDPISQASFHSWLASIYSNNIAALNANWKSAYTSFNAVVMATNYPSDRNNPGYYDLIQWRKKSIADYVAIGAMAARKADPNHLLTYSMVGGSFVAFDALNTCEDAKTIVARCAQAGAPLSFWSINNYASTATGSEMRAADFGISKHRAQSGLPVLVTETGHSSTDDLNPEEPQRYSQALPTQLWEALISGAMGVHIFTWNDRDLFAGPFIREKGFGIVNQNRTPKEPVYTNIANTFRRMANLDLPALLGASTDPRPEIQFLWTRYGDVVWPRANFENAQVWGALERLGYQCGIIDEDQFDSGAGTNSPALLLSRCMMMDPVDLDRIATNLIFAGINVHANADLPGQYTPYHALNANWASRMNSLFGLNVGAAVTGLDSGVVDLTFGAMTFSGMGNLGNFTPAYSDQIASWKIWHGIPINSGTVVSHTGLNGSQPAIPALQVKNLGAAKTAINTFALGDVENAGALPQEHTWDFRYMWLHAIYHDWFGIQPRIELSGPGAGYVYSDYRVCRNGSVLMGLLNGAKSAATVTLSATNLLVGKTVENLTSGGIVELSSDGVVNLNMNGDDYALLYAYSSAGGLDVSLLNSNPNKLWISNAPAVVWPTGSDYNLIVGYDLQDPNLSLVASFERVLCPNLVFAQATNGALVSGRGTAAIPLRIPDADYNNSWYVSSRAGGEYVLRARLLKNGAAVSDTFIPVRLLWPVHPVSLPTAVTPGGTCQVVLDWEELPAWLASEGSAPLDRARLWQPWLASQQYYKVVLELRSAGQLVAQQEALVNTGSGQQTFTVVVPPNATGPYTWTAYLQSVPNASVDMVDSFEDRDTGEGTNTYLPWVMLTYPEGVPIYQNSGVAPSEGLPGGAASDGKQALFMVLTNPPNPQGFSGSFIYYTYPKPWALPRDFSQWSNYWFSFDFRETNGLDCVLEMQIKDVHGGLMNFTKRYNPAAGWDRAEATLDQFTVPSWVGRFDPEAVAQLVVNVQLLKTNVQYLAYLDNVQFVGPKTMEQTTAPRDLWDSFDDRNSATGSAGVAALSPWNAYVYPPPTTRQLDQGIVLYQGLRGGQAALMVVTNPAGLGPISTLGLYRPFDSTWSLPADTNAWRNYRLSYWFREANRLRCRVEMQVKSDANNWIEFGRDYNPGPDGWDYVSASLDEFVQPAGIGLFDRTHLLGIALNVRLLQTNAIYVAFFDDVFFETPETIVPSGTPFGIYYSTNDSAPDATTFVIDQIRAGANGEVILSWLARSNRVYCLEFEDSPLTSLEYFQPVPGQSGLNRLTDGVLTATDTNAALSAARFYRIRAQPR